MTWTKTGNIRGPQGIPGAASTVAGPKGDAGATGPPGPGLAAGGAVNQRLIKTGAADYQTGWEARKRYWRLFGDNSGDSANTSNTVWSTVKSPVFTILTTGWHKITANFGALVGAAGVQGSYAVMIDANVGQMFYFTGAASYHVPVNITAVLSLTVGQTVRIGYRPVVAGKSVTLVNSGTVVPFLLVEEMDAPS